MRADFSRPSLILLAAILLAGGPPARPGAQEQPGAEAQSGYRIRRSYFLPPQYYVGDLVELRLEIETAPGVVLEEGEVSRGGEEAGAAFRLPDLPGPVPALEVDFLTLRRTGEGRYLASVGFRPFRPGRLRLPPLPAGGVLLRGLEAQVLSALKGEDRLQEPREPLPLPGTVSRVAVLLLLGLGGPLAAAAAALSARRAFRQALRLAQWERPARRLRRSLRRLEVELPRLEPRAFFFRLSTALRVYLEERLGIPARALTTAELEAALARAAELRAGLPAAGGGPGEAVAPEEIGWILRRADRFKFSGERASADEMAEDLGGVREVFGRLERQAAATPRGAQPLTPPPAEAASSAPSAAPSAEAQLPPAPSAAPGSMGEAPGVEL